MSRSLCLVFQPDLLQRKFTVQHNLIKKKLQDSQALIKPPTTAAVREGVQNRGLNCLVSRSTHVPGVPGACFSHRIGFFPLCTSPLLRLCCLKSRQRLVVFQLGTSCSNQGEGGSKRAGRAPAVCHWHRTNVLVWGLSDRSLPLPSAVTFSAGRGKMCGPKHNLTEFSEYLLVSC